MGLLDEAIREHLDLKRRRGADPAEVERAERDALGPVRRGPEEAIASEPDLSPVAEGSFAYDQEGESQEWDGSFGEGPQPLSPLSASDAGFEPATAGDPEESPALAEPLAFDEPPDIEDRLAAHDTPFEAGAGRPALAPDSDPAPPTDYPKMPAPHPAGERFGDETVEYRLEHEPEGQPPSEGEDVLEETPEFLQDAPEHDRLWFEQRPPRDFDFDG